MPLALALFMPSPERSPVAERMFTPLKSSAGPVMRAKPMPSFLSVSGSKPHPSPKDVYCASSSPQVIGQLSLSIALRLISGANVILRITGLAGYGPRSVTAPSRGQDVLIYGLPEAEPMIGHRLAVTHHDQIQAGYDDDELM